MNTTQKHHTLSFFGKITVLLFLLFGITSGVLSAQILDYQNKLSIALDDGIQVIMYGKAKTLSNKYTGEYYYLPTNLRLSMKRNDPETPEFLFMKYTTDDPNDVQGALMHFLMEWGLTAEQEAELQTKLEAKIDDLKNNAGSPFKAVKNPKVMGPVDLRSDTEESFRIISGTLTSEEFTPNLVTTGHAPLVPGSKISVASILEKNGAQLLAATFEEGRSITDVSLNLRFRYDVLTPKVNGKITVDWSKVDQLYQKFTRDYEHRDEDDGTMPASNSLKDDIITDTQKDSLYMYMQETKAVTVEMDISEVDNPIAQELVTAFMDYFLSSISEQEFAKPDAPEPLDEISEYKPNKNLYQYHLSREKFDTRIQKKTEVYTLNVRLPITQEVSITENLASWYDGVKDNSKCVNSVNLNDKFFQHRDVNFILDLSAKDIFNEEVNYVTVNVRKKRSSGDDFSDQVTIDQDYLEKNGTKASITYARGEDNNPDLFEYKSQWSLKGGNLYPEKPKWKKGDWQGVTLAPPIKPRTIIFEADAAELEELDIIRATLELRYYKYGKEYHDEIPLSITKKQNVAEKIIFMDKEATNYGARIVLFHKREGKMALDWQPQTSDWNYALIPEELINEEAEFIDKIKEAAKKILEPNEDGSVNPADAILEILLGD